MAVIKGFFNDSRTFGKVWTVAGYVGDDLAWNMFENLWPLAMNTHGVPYFHMKEMADPRGVYAKWHPPEDHDPERAAFFQHMAKTLSFCGLRGIGSTAIETDVQRFNRENNLNLDSYALARLLLHAKRLA